MSIVLYSSAAVAVAIGQLQLQLIHYSLVALQAFCFPKCDFWGGLEKKFRRLAIARCIFRPSHKLCYNSTTAAGLQETVKNATLRRVWWAGEVAIQTNEWWWASDRWTECCVVCNVRCDIRCQQKADCNSDDMKMMTSQLIAHSSWLTS